MYIVIDCKQKATFFVSQYKYYQLTYSDIKWTKVFSRYIHRFIKSMNKYESIQLTVILITLTRYVRRMDIVT